MQLVSLNDVKVILREYIKKSSRIGAFLSTYNTTGQLTSVAAEGTPPLIVSSTTLVPGLNADLLDGHHATDFVTTMDAIDTIVLETIDDRVANTLLQDTAAVTWTYDDAANTLTPTISHAGLTGLAADDHTLYARVDGNRAFTGDQTFNMDVNILQTLTTAGLKMPAGAIDGYVLRTDNFGNANWEPDSAPSHSDLTGLTGDDHPQYLLTDGSRVCTGDQRFSSNVSIDDWLETGYFKMAVGAAAGRVLSCDATGIGTWQALINTHSGLGGLTADDHPQYLYLYGRAGGQLTVGGIGAGENLTLQSTDHATRGKIIFGTSTYDEANNRLGVATATPAYSLDVSGNTRTTGFIMPTGAGVGYVLQSNATGVASWGIVPSGVTDHGATLGLADDDHPQYSLINGTRAFTGTVGGVAPIAVSDLTTKGYVDALVAASGVLEHGSLIGLVDDDHLQYLRTDGTRNSTGNQIFEQDVEIQGSGIVSGVIRTHDNIYMDGANSEIHGGHGVFSVDVETPYITPTEIGTDLTIGTQYALPPDGDQATGDIIISPGCYVDAYSRQGSIILDGHVAGSGSLHGDITILGGQQTSRLPASVEGGSIHIYGGQGDPSGGDITIRAGYGSHANFAPYIADGGDISIIAGNHDIGGGEPGRVLFTTAGIPAAEIRETDFHINRNIIGSGNLYVEGSGIFIDDIRSEGDVHATHFYGDGSALTGVGVSDHGGLAGLGDDDHPQYVLADGTRAMTKLDVTTSGVFGGDVRANAFYGDGSNLSGVGAATDHGTLVGLADDDHPQYSLTDGSRNITGDQTLEQDLFVTGSGTFVNALSSETNIYTPALVLLPQTSVPGSPEEGTIYYNKDDKQWYGWDGSIWVILG